MEQQIRFCTTSDGVRIAYSQLGEGAPVVIAPGIYSHLEEEWRLPWRRAWYEKLAGSCRLIRYDRRGTGFSPRGDFTYTAEVLVIDIEAVVAAAGLGQFAILAITLGGAAALLYAARHPERVTHIAVHGCSDRGSDLYDREALAPLLTMARQNWAMASVLASNLATGVVAEDRRRADEAYVKSAVDGETFARLLELSYSLDLSDALPQVKAPVLVIHQEGDRTVPVAYGRRLAASLPNARFLPVWGDSSVPLYGPSDEIMSAIVDFLGLPPPAEAAAGMAIVLFTDIAGSTELTRQIGDARAQELLRSHNAIVRNAIHSRGGREIKHTGDGLMASFTSASQALECAIAIQSGIGSHRAENPDTPIRVRVGINAGEPVVEERDLFGTSVQLAARICAAAEPGEVLVSNVVRELVAGKGFAFSDRGEATLKGFEEPVRLWAVGLATR